MSIPTVSKLAIVATDKELQRELVVYLKTQAEAEALSALRSDDPAKAAFLPLADKIITGAVQRIIKDHTPRTAQNEGNEQGNDLSE